MKQKVTFSVLVLLVLLVTGCRPCPPCPEYPTPTTTPTVMPTQTPQAILWDSRLDEYRVSVEPVANARYKLIAAWMTLNGSWDGVPSWAWYYVDKATGGGGDHNMFAGVYKLDDSPQPGKNVIFGWPGTQTSFLTDDAGWGNGDCQAVYYPDKGQSGPYYLQPLKGDILRGGGLPYGQHVSIFGVWKEQPPVTVLDAIMNLLWGNK